PARRDRAGRHPGAGRQPGRCGKASKRPSRFVARTGRSHLSRNGLCHGIGPIGGLGRSGPRRDRPQARVQIRRADGQPAARVKVVTMSLATGRKAELIKSYATKSGDTRSPEVEVAILAELMTDPTKHF